jgi:hypothetical protein
MDNFCEVNICVEDGIPTGTISGLERTITFNPRTILCDLRYDNQLVLSLQNDSFLFDEFDYAYEYAFDPEYPFEIDKRDQYVAVVTAIIAMIKESNISETPIDFYKVDALRSFFDITFQFTPSIQEKNWLASYSKDVQEHIELNVHYAHYSVKSALNFDVSNYHNYFYECYSLSDLIYAILHFLALGKYKFSMCPHCNRYFATTTYKQKYCYRRSNYPGFEHLNCEQVVRNILQDLRRQRQRINRNLDLNYNSKYEEFFSKSNELIARVMEEPSRENIDNAYNYINIDRHYTKTKKKR